jgi:O-methyltransferase
MIIGHSTVRFACKKIVILFYKTSKKLKIVLRPVKYAVLRKKYSAAAHQFFSPHELGVMYSAIEKTHNVPGVIMEAGCFVGSTTISLKKYMEKKGIEKKYIAIDTWAGFQDDDVAYEIEHRGKSAALFGEFGSGQLFFEDNLKNNGITGVVALKADAKNVDFNAIGPISFCLVDVDLYKPISEVLPKIYKNLSLGGIIIVDDVKENTRYDGAYLAYTEFVESKNLPFKVVYDKLGLIEKT